MSRDWRMDPWKGVLGGALIPGSGDAPNGAPDRRKRLACVNNLPRGGRVGRLRTVSRTVLLGAASWVLPVCGWFR